MPRHQSKLRRSVAAMTVLAMVSFYAISAWAATCEQCTEMPCCDSMADDTPTPELVPASCCDIAPMGAMRALSEQTPATVDGPTLDLVAAAADVDQADVQRPSSRVLRPAIANHACAPLPTRTIVLLL